jgi:D-inositol-3-phosphate glycosyltransferase
VTMPAGRRPISLIGVGAWLPGSGFTRVLSAVLGRLAASFDVHYIGLGYKGPTFVEGGLTLHPSNLQGGDVFGAYQCAKMVQALDARLVLLLNDHWMLRAYPRTLGPLRDRVRTIAYVPIDGPLHDDALLGPLATLDDAVAYTTFGQRELTNGLARLAQRDPALTVPRVSVIPHGVDTATFRPLGGSVEAQLRPAGRLAARRRLWPDEPDWHDAFIVLNANRPMPRKRIDLTIEGFARFAQGKPPTVKLWLHHAIMNAEERAGLVAQATRAGIQDRLRLSALGASPLSDEALCLAYNAADVGLNTAMGEGWGLVSFEHAATGAAQVVPRSSACTELWDGAAEMVETTDAGVPPFTLLGMREPSVAGVAQALERLYADRQHLRAMSLAAYRNAVQPAYSWDAIAEQWCALLDDVLARRAA